jgi:hypothetical protein
MLKIPTSSKKQENDMASLRRRMDTLAKSFVSVTEMKVPVRRLDELAPHYPGRLGLKLDTEGAELEVLQGAVETLKRAEFVLLEMSVTPRFEGVGLPSDIVALLAEAGLELRDVFKFGAGAGKKSHPRYMDVLFARWAA